MADISEATYSDDGSYTFSHMNVHYMVQISEEIFYTIRRFKFNTPVGFWNIKQKMRQAQKAIEASYHDRIAKDKRGKTGRVVFEGDYEVVSYEEVNAYMADKKDD